MKLKSKLYGEDDLKRSIKRIAHEILENSENTKKLCLIGIKTRGVPLARRLCECIKTIEGITVPVGVLDITLYRDDLDYIKANGKLVIGITDYEPMNYRDKNGEWTGFDTEFAQKVCEKLGVKAEFVEIDWDNKFLALESKAIDCIWNGMTITEERKANMSISTPYMENRQVMIVKATNVEKFMNMVHMMNL